MMELLAYCAAVMGAGWLFEKYQDWRDRRRGCTRFEQVMADRRTREQVEASIRALEAEPAEWTWERSA